MLTKLAKRLKHSVKLQLSGTPAQNNPSELAPLLKMLRPEDKSVGAKPGKCDNNIKEEGVKQ